MAALKEAETNLFSTTPVAKFTGSVAVTAGAEPVVNVHT